MQKPLTRPNDHERPATLRGIAQDVSGMNIVRCNSRCMKCSMRERAMTNTVAATNRHSLPTYGQMLKHQTQLPERAEQMQQLLEDGYKNLLY